jgi:hypothetical protein
MELSQPSYWVTRPLPILPYVLPQLHSTRSAYRCEDRTDSGRRSLANFSSSRLTLRSTVLILVPVSLKRQVVFPSLPSWARARADDQIHAEAHDPNASMLVPVSEEDRQKKAQGIPAGFVNGRQKGLDKWVEVSTLSTAH